MNETNSWVPAHDSSEALAEELERLNDKLDRMMGAVALMDRRREDLEEMLADLLPAANGAMEVATHQLWELEARGTLGLARETIGALGEASVSIDPRDLRALGANAGRAVRTMRALTGPDVAAASERAVAALQHARTGKPPGLFTLLRRLRQPHVRRGLGAAMEILEALGEGAHPLPALEGAVGPTVRRTAAAPPTTPRNPAGPPPTAGAAPTTPLRTVAGAPVAVDADGFLADSADWTPEVAEAMAAQVGIGPLTDEHWRVLEFCRSDAEGSGGAPGLRRITRELDIPPRDMYRLFPKGPGTLAARLAGLKKPKSCV